MTFDCTVRERAGMWTAEHTGPDIGPVRASGATREEALQKLEGEIRYWLEMCPCSGQNFRNVEIRLIS